MRQIKRHVTKRESYGGRDVPRNDRQQHHETLRTEPHTWADRLVKHEPAVPVDEMLANGANWRIHPGPQQELIRESLETLGWLRAVLVNIHTGCIVDGHQRVLEADKAGQRTVPVDYVDMTLEEEQQALATLDAITAMAVADRPKLDELIQAIGEDRRKAGKDGFASAPAMDAFLASLQEDRRVSHNSNGSGGYSGAQVDREPAVIGTTYENNPTRQIVLHYGAEDYAWMVRCLAWARDHYGVDTTTEAITIMAREVWVEAGSPDLPEARRGGDE